MYSDVRSTPLRNLTAQVYSEAKKVRAKAREVNWDLTNNLSHSFLEPTADEGSASLRPICEPWIPWNDSFVTHETSPVPTAHSMRMQMNFHPISSTL